MGSRSNMIGFTRFALAAGLAAMLTMGPLAVRADDVSATPAAVAVACETEPIDARRYAEAAADTGDDVPIAEPVPYRTVEGQPADEATVDRVEAVVGQVVACVNEGRTSTVLSLFTVAFLERHAAETGGVPDDTLPEPIAAEMRLSLVRVAEVTMRENGRTAALVVFDQSEREAPELTSLVTFEELAGRLLIDDWQPVTHPGDVTATPVAEA